MPEPRDPHSTNPPSDSASPPGGPSAADRTRPARRPYTPPRIASREKIEGRANVCDPLTGGKTGPGAGCSVARS